MQYDKERRDAVVDILSRMKTGELSNEDGEQMLRSFSPQLVEAARATMEEGWKKNVQIENQVAKRPVQEMTPARQAMAFTVPLIGVYTAFAAVLHMLGLSAGWTPPEWAPWLSNLIIAQYVFGGIGVLAALLTVKQWAPATLISALWLAGAGYVFRLWASPLPLGGVVLLVFIVQLIMKNEKRHPLLTAVGGIFLGGGAAMLVEAFAVREETVDLTEAVDKVAQRDPVFGFILAGVLALVIGIILIIVGIRKSGASD